MLEDCRQRFMTQTQKAELPLGLYIIRGTEIVLIGAIVCETRAGRASRAIPRSNWPSAPRAALSLHGHVGWLCTQDEEKEAAQELTTVPMPEIQAAIKAEEEAAIAKGETPYAASWKMRMSI